MKKNTVRSLILLSTASLIVVFGFYLSSNKKVNHQYNSFTRIFKDNLLQVSKVLDIQYSSYYLAGNSTIQLYLGNFVDPTHLLQVHTSLTDTQHVKLHIEKLAYRAIKVTVDSPYFYIADGSQPFIYRGKIMDWQAKRYLHDSTYFTEAIPISPRSFALRTMNSAYENTLGKKEVNPSNLKLYHNILEKQIDGIFCTDGMLLYNQKSAQLIYVYFYRNQYIVMDTSFQVLYRANTIDTISQAKIKTASLESKETTTFKMSAPPLLVNKKGTVSGDYLFIHSNILAKNEDPKQFDRESVIDVYNLKNKSYTFSFYLPLYQGEKPREFKVLNDKTLIALYNHYLIAYRLNTPLLF